MADATSIEELFHIPENATLEPLGGIDSAYLEENIAPSTHGAVHHPISRKPSSTVAAVSTPEQFRHSRCLVIGRQATSVDLRIAHASVSRIHAVLYFMHCHDDAAHNAYCLYLVDGGGKYGTRVNGTRVPSNERYQLHNGDSVVFGNVSERIFVVRMTTAETAGDTSAITDDETHTRVSLTQDEVNTTSATRIATATDKEGTLGRAQREAEIAAMISSLDEEPVFQKHTNVEETLTDSGASSSPGKNILSSFTSQEKKFAEQLPIQQQLEIASESSRRSMVTCLAIDPAGSRFTVGSTDSNLRFYDFGGMARNRVSSFLTVIPTEGQLLVSCAYSNTGDRILVGTTCVQPVVLDRDGNRIIQFMRGDMYVTDQAKTVGHTSAITSVDWHPLERDWVLTSSQDGSARLWNLQGKTQFDMLVCNKVFQAKSARGLRTAVSCVAFHPSGREFVLGTACGSIQVWNHARASNRPERTVYEVHGKDNAVTSLVFNLDGSKLASRSADDDKVKIWDSRRMSRSCLPNFICEGLTSLHSCSNSAFSPDGKVLCAGTSVMLEQQREVGQMHFYDVSDAAGSNPNLSPQASFNFPQGISPIVIKWHSKLKQIFVGCSDGKVIILYDPVRSKNGALLVSSIHGGDTSDSLTAILRTRAEASGGVTGKVMTPFALPMFREEETSERKRKREERRDPTKSKEPERPASGKHKVGGQEGSSVTFAQYVADQRGVKSKAIAGSDPREALLGIDKTHTGKPEEER